MELYLKSLSKSWFHQYLMGKYFNKNGDAFLLVRIDKISEEHPEKQAQFIKSSEEYKNIYSKDIDSNEKKKQIIKFVNTFLKTNKFSTFYHLYWMGYVCDSYVIPFYMKNKVCHSYSKKYNTLNEENITNFNKYLEECIQNKNPKKKKVKETNDVKKTPIVKMRNDSEAVFIGKQSVPHTPSAPPQRNAVDVKKKTPLVRMRNDSEAVFIGKQSVPHSPPKEKSIIQPLNPELYYERNPDAFVNPNRFVKKILNKTRKKIKKRNLKNEMRRLKLQMANLL